MLKKISIEIYATKKILASFMLQKKNCEKYIEISNWEKCFFLIIFGVTFVILILLNVGK